MNYSQTIDFLFSQTPQFQQIGAAAYKPGLGTVRKLADAFGNPQHKLRCVHVAGTNGKGSTSHSIASVLQAAGYKVGLFTSPHLIDFRERIRINGEMIPEDAVIRFVEQCRTTGVIERLQPSFFELTTIMAFKWFADCEVDLAVIEVGLGGRLDSTNIISPVLSVITNISKDHTAQLGNTLAEIASEKAGIIKPGIPVVIGEASEEIAEVFRRNAQQEEAPIIFAQQALPAFEESCRPANDTLEAPTPFGTVSFDLTGDCQKLNLRTIITALSQLRRIIQFPDKAVLEGLSNVRTNTGLMGRWMQLSDKPLTICDTGHNIGGWELLGPRLGQWEGPLFMVIGFVNDKDITHILPLMPRKAHYLFTRASVPRALPAENLASTAREAGLHGEVIPSGVDEAIRHAQHLAAQSQDSARPMIFIGGSTFVVADALKFFNGPTD